MDARHHLRKQREAALKTRGFSRLFFSRRRAGLLEADTSLLDAKWPLAGATRTRTLLAARFAERSRQLAARPGGAQGALCRAVARWAAGLERSLSDAYTLHLGFVGGNGELMC